MDNDAKSQDIVSGRIIPLTVQNDEEWDPEYVPPSFYNKNTKVVKPGKKNKKWNSF